MTTVKKKISLFIMSSSLKGACGVYRLGSPIKYLERENLIEATYLLWDVEYSAADMAHLEKRLSLADIVIFQRELPLEAMFLFGEFIKNDDEKIFVYETDDRHIEVPLWHPFFFDLFEYRNVIKAIVSEVDAVTVTTTGLVDYMKKINPSVYILPNLIDPEYFSQNSETETPKREKIVIVHSGAPTHQNDFKTVVPAIKRILKEYNGRVIFYAKGFVPEELIDHPWFEYSYEVIDYKDYIIKMQKESFSFDIGISPVEDNSYNRCRSNLKFLEYSMYGIPGVWSKVSYGNVVVDGENGILVRQHNTESWYKALKSLIDDEELRKKLAINAKRTVVENYLLPNHVHKWYTLYKSLVDTRKKGSKIKKKEGDIYKEFIEKFFLIKRNLSLFYKSNNNVVEKLLRYYNNILNLSREIPNLTYRSLLRASVYSKISLLYNYHGSIDKAGEIFKKAERLFHKSQFEENSDNLLKTQLARLHYNLGSIYEREGLLDKAKEKFERVVKPYDKGDTKRNLAGGAHFHLGCIHQRMGEIEKARQHFEKCLELIPEHRKAKEIVNTLEEVENGFKAC